jgi:hypothetical protein
MARMDIRPIDLILLIGISINLGVWTLTKGLGVAMAIANAVIGFLAGLGTLLLARKVKKIVKKKQQ